MIDLLIKYSSHIGIFLGLVSVGFNIWSVTDNKNKTNTNKENKKRHDSDLREIIERHKSDLNEIKTRHLSDLNEIKNRHDSDLRSHQFLLSAIGSVTTDQTTAGLVQKKIVADLRSGGHIEDRFALDIYDRLEVAESNYKMVFGLANHFEKVMNSESSAFQEHIKKSIETGKLTQELIDSSYFGSEEITEIKPEPMNEQTIF